MGLTLPPPQAKLVEPPPLAQEFAIKYYRSNMSYKTYRTYILLFDFCFSLSVLRSVLSALCLILRRSVS